MVDLPRCSPTWVASCPYLGQGMNRGIHLAYRSLHLTPPPVITSALCYRSWKPHFMVKPAAQRIRGHIQVVVHLRAEPEFGRGAKILRQTQGGVSRDAALA